MLKKRKEFTKQEEAQVLLEVFREAGVEVELRGADCGAEASFVILEYMEYRSEGWNIWEGIHEVSRGYLILDCDLFGKGGDFSGKTNRHC